MEEQNARLRAGQGRQACESGRAREQEGAWGPWGGPASVVFLHPRRGASRAKQRNSGWNFPNVVEDVNLRVKKLTDPQTGQIQRKPGLDRS